MLLLKAYTTTRFVQIVKIVNYQNKKLSMNVNICRGYVSLKQWKHSDGKSLSCNTLSLFICKNPPPSTDFAIR